MSANSGSLKIVRRPLRVLLVEDWEPDALLLMRALDRGGFAVTSRRVESRAGLLEALKEEWDLVLADHSMPQFSAPEALELVQEQGLDLPFIIVSGHIEEGTAVSAMKAGAHDYIMKDRLGRLVPAVERELREAAVRRAVRESKAELLRAHDELEQRVEQRTADLRTANLALQKVLEERRRLENELLEIAENERRRIGFDLHDDLGQKLTGVSMMLKGLERRLSLDSHPSAAEAGKIQALIEQVINHTHNLAHNFSSLDAKGNDLPEILGSLAENVKKMFGISCALDFKGTAASLPRDTSLQLYKIAQEAVSNAIKHGKAKRVMVAVNRAPDHLVLTIQNDGVPFVSPNGGGSRMGLRIMNYRANTIGATLEIRPFEKGGTIVTCTLPLKAAERPAPKELPRSKTLAPPPVPPAPLPGPPLALVNRL